MTTLADPAVLEEVARDPTSLTLRLVPAHARAACAGHFPGDPLIPGSRLAGLGATAAAALLATERGVHWRFTGVQRATFSSPARPSAQIELRAERAGDDGRVAVEITGDGDPLAWIALRFEVVP